MLQFHSRSPHRHRQNRRCQRRRRNLTIHRRRQRKLRNRQKLLMQYRCHHFQRQREFRCHQRRQRRRHRQKDKAMQCCRHYYRRYCLGLAIQTECCRFLLSLFRYRNHHRRRPNRHLIQTQLGRLRHRRRRQHW